MNESKQPKYVAGYWRNKSDEPQNETETKTQKDKGPVIFLYTMLAYSVLLLLTPGWVVGLPVVGTYAIVKTVHAGIALADYRAKHGPEPKLTINYS
jgi:asparagine N-glycosylation enzyme membrane subunit Stt3